MKNSVVELRESTDNLAAGRVKVGSVKVPGPIKQASQKAAKLSARISKFTQIKAVTVRDSDRLYKIVGEFYELAERLDFLEGDLRDKVNANTFEGR